MDKQQKKFKNTFSQFIAAASKGYKNINDINNESYLIGKKEGYEEILNMFLTCTQGDIKYVSESSFHNNLSEKIKKYKASLTEEEDDKMQNCSEIKITEKRKRINQNELDLTNINFNNILDPGYIDSNILNNTINNYSQHSHKKKKFK